MLKQLRSVGIVSCVKVAALLYAILGFIIGALLSLFALLGVAIGAFGNEGNGALGGVIFGVGAVIVFPILYGIIGTVAGLIMSGLYNLVAKATGGIELEID